MVSHMPEINPFLQEYFQLLDDGKLKGKRIFVPFCGKSLDMKWFYEKGMSVVGVEVSELPAREFFSGNNLEYEVEHSTTVPHCKIYRHDDRLCIYLCDIFNLDSKLLGGRFDYLWDRGALVAVIHEERELYWNFISSILADNAQGFIELNEFDSTQHTGPPYDFSKDCLARLLGDKYSFKQICIRKEDEMPEFYRTTKFEGLYLALYFIKRNC